MFVWILGGAVAVVHAVAEVPDFSRYQVIVARMPFGAESVAQAGAATNAPAGPPAESFAKNLKMCAITRNARTGKLQVGLVDAVTKKNYFLKLGDEEDGICLVEADYEEEKALLKKGSEQVWLKMSSGADMAVAAVGVPRVPAPVATMAPAPRPITSPGMPPAQGTPPVASQAPAGGSTPSERFAAMRIRRTEPLTKTTPEVKPGDSVALAPPPGEGGSTRSPQDLQKHLQEYQMDLIRSGGAKGPPLPLPLTPEMDQKLVDEGVLPAQ